jgi:multimeric flavodoxin WrbA
VKQLLIVYHTQTGGTLQMASAAAKAASQESSIAVRLEVATAVGPEALLEASGYLFACPENLGTMSGLMKEMFDRNYYPLLGRIEGRPYATVIAAGSDGRGSQAQIDRIVTGWRLRRVADPLIVNLAAQTPEAILARKTVPAGQIEQCRDLGAALNEGLRLGIF